MGLPTHNEIQAFIPKLLDSMPYEWKGTTFNNSAEIYHGREKFIANLINLIAEKKNTKEVSSNDLSSIGNAEDYLRVATNVCTALETALASPFQKDGRQYIKPTQVFTWSSTKMPFVGVMIEDGRVKSKGGDEATVHFYFPDGADGGILPFSDEDKKLLSKLAAKFEMHNNKSVPVEGVKGGITVVVKGEGTPTEEMAKLLQNKVVDAVITPCVLYIRNTEKINPANILVIRKRMATPTTTPMSMYMLEQASNSGEGKHPRPEFNDPGKEADFYGHLQELSGTPRDPDCNPVVFTAGLPCICAVYYALIEQGGADLVMCSTAYGGSSQVTDLLRERAGTFSKHTFHIQGDAIIDESISFALDKLARKEGLPSGQTDLFPTTVLFVEIPTNPDMKVPDIGKVVSGLAKYKEATGKKVLLLVDTTFAPASKVLQKVKEKAPELEAMVFISMSKSVSRGITTAGAVIANHTPGSKALCQRVRFVSKMLDTCAKPDQLERLCNNHRGAEERCKLAYELAKDVGEVLVKQVKKSTGQDMNLAFVSPANAKLNFTSSTFSFNLPSPPKATSKVKEEFAQKFVDLLCLHPTYMKPCVSFGQDNDLVYCTVPATSTQGAISAEDKAKQARGGVQLVRLSFPVKIAVEKVRKIVRNAVILAYHHAAEEIEEIELES